MSRDRLNGSVLNVRFQLIGRVRVTKSFEFDLAIVLSAQDRELIKTDGRHQS